MPTDTDPCMFCSRPVVRGAPKCSFCGALTGRPTAGLPDAAAARVDEAPPAPASSETMTIRGATPRPRLVQGLGVFNLAAASAATAMAFVAFQRIVTYDDETILWVATAGLGVQILNLGAAVLLASLHTVGRWMTLAGAGANLLLGVWLAYAVGIEAVLHPATLAWGAWSLVAAVTMLLPGVARACRIPP